MDKARSAIVKVKVMAMLRAEGISLDDKEKAIESLNECALPSVVKRAYLELLEG